MRVETLRYFGERWDVPMLADAEQDSTPVGVACCVCQEPIQDGDRGLWQTVFRAPPPLAARELPVHAECHMMKVIGHSFGICGCTGHGAGDRRSALELARRVQIWQESEIARWP